MTSNRVATVLSLLCLAALAPKSYAASATIDFETMPSGATVTYGTPLNVQYASQGVIFDYQQPPFIPYYEIAPNSLPAHSGMFVAVGPDYSMEFSGGDFQITFTSLQSLVQLWGGSGCGNVPGSLTAFNCVGTVCNIVAPVDMHLLTANKISVLFTVSTTTPQINKVSFVAGNPTPLIGCDEEIDDLHIEGDPPPSAGGPPSINLTAPPTGNSDFSTQPLQAVGTYTGTNLFQLEIDLITLDTSSGQPLTQQFFFVPQASGTNVPFSFPLKTAGQLAIGHYQIVAKLTDRSSQQAQTSVNFSNFPPPLTETDPTLGPFRFGVNDENCSLAFYQAGAVAKFPQGHVPLTIPVPSVIAEKWRTVNTPILWPKQTLGCPISESRGVTAFASWVIQDFERGRIYVPPQGPAVFVPQIFRSALAALMTGSSGDVVESEFFRVGWPVVDPDYDLEVENPTWVFQRFAQQDLGPIAGPPTWNTLEIRGRMPALYVERVGGDPVERSNAQATPTDQFPQARINSSTPTEWQVFPCAKLATDRWPTSCDLSGLIPLTGSPAPSAPVAELCGGEPGCESGQSDECSTHNCPTSGVSPPPPDWASTVNNDNLTLYQGIIRDLDVEGPDMGSHLANRDNPLDHTYCNPTIGRDLGSLGDIGLGLVDCLGAIIGVSDCDVVSKAKNIDYCRSDWNLHTRPLPTQTNWDFLSQANSLPGSSNATTPLVDFETEFEVDFAQEYFKQFLPQPGDLLTVHGRRIVDCGHCPYRAEVHPPDLVIVERSIVYFPVFGNTGEPQFRATDAYLWANAFLPNTNGVISPLAAAVQAPPRTSSSAKLHIQQHETGYFLLQNGLQVTVQPVTDGASITFSGSGAPAIEQTDRGQWIYPGPPSPGGLVLWMGAPDGSTLVGPKYVDNWQIAWTAFPN